MGRRRGTRVPTDYTNTTCINIIFNIIILIIFFYFYCSPVYIGPTVAPSRLCNRVYINSSGASVDGGPQGPCRGTPAGEEDEQKIK